MVSDFNTNCVGKNSCNFNPSNYFTFQNTTSSTDPCTINPARFNLQYYCKQSSSVVNQKRDVGLLVACLGIFSCFLLMLTVTYMKQSSVLEFQIWDFSTVTAGDFTVEMKISELMWKTFMNIYEFNGELDRTS